MRAHERRAIVKHDSVALARYLTLLEAPAL